MMNFDGSQDSVSTLAHELGHAFHNVALAERTPLQRRLPMALAETASIFCETLLFEHAAEHAADDVERLALLDTHLVGATQTVVDIHSRFLFETELCARRRRTTLSVADMKAAMLDAQEAAYGDGLHPDHRHEYMWAVKGHYFTPFYNWPYTFGLLFGIGLYARYLRRSRALPLGLRRPALDGRHGRRGRARRTVRVRRPRRRLLGRQPRGARSPHRRLRAPRRARCRPRDEASRAGGRRGDAPRCERRCRERRRRAPRRAGRWSGRPRAASPTGTWPQSRVSRPRRVCFAVGTPRHAASVVDQLIERWNGTKWTALVEHRTRRGSSSSQLTAVLCISTVSCIAVGQYNTPALTTKTLVMRWDGRSGRSCRAPTRRARP